VTIPTNIDVTRSTRGRFGAVYAALFDRMTELHTGAVVTEYACGARSCDQCPPRAGLSGRDLAALGAAAAFPDEKLRGLRNVDIRVTARPARARDPYPVEQIAEVVRRHRAELRHCYQDVARGDPTLSGQLHVRFVVDPAGSARRVTLRRSTLDSERVAHCVLSAIRNWSFSEPPNGEPATIEQSFRFSARPRGAARAPPERVRWDGLLDELVVTRLHHRIRPRGPGEELVLRPAGPIAGGREEDRSSRGLLAAMGGASQNTFQTRYVIRHAWEGPMECAGRFRGVFPPYPPDGREPAPIVPALGLGHASAADVDLDAVFVGGIPELGIAPAPTEPEPESEREETGATHPAARSRDETASSRGCGGCTTTSRGSPAAVILAPGFLILVLLRRRGSPRWPTGLPPLRDRVGSRSD